MHAVEAWISGRRVEDRYFTDQDWFFLGEPWEGIPMVGGEFPALWAKALPDGTPPPGYGSTYSPDDDYGAPAPQPTPDDDGGWAVFGIAEA